MKAPFFLVLVVLISCPMACMGGQRTDVSQKETSGSIGDELKKIQETVQKEFAYKFPETSSDLLKVKKAALILVRASGRIKNSETLHVYWKKTMLEDANALQKGYLILAVNNSGKIGCFGAFWEDSKILDVESFGMMGSLKIENESVDCEDCEGGLWSQNYIQDSAKELLKGKYFEMKLKK